MSQIDPRIMKAARNSPIVYAALSLHWNDVAAYEKSLEEAVLALVDHNERLAAKLVDAKMRCPIILNAPRDTPPRQPPTK